MTLSAFRQMIVDMARAEIGVKELPVNVVPYAPRTVRRGAWINVQGLAWCNRFATDIAWRAWSITVRGDRLWIALPDSLLLEWSPSRRENMPPFTYRAAVSELYQDARACGAWIDVIAALAPLPGDLLVFGRDNEDPRRGGKGHVGIVVEVSAEEIEIISGNDGDEVRARRWSRNDPAPWPVVGWIRVEA